MEYLKKRGIKEDRGITNFEDLTPYMVEYERDELGGTFMGRYDVDDLEDRDVIVVTIKKLKEEDGYGYVKNSHDLDVPRTLNILQEEVAK